MGVYKISLYWDGSICRHCCACTAMCARGALSVDPETGYLQYNIKDCIRCGNCTRACPSGALRAIRLEDAENIK